MRLTNLGPTKRECKGKLQSTRENYMVITQEQRRTSWHKPAAQSMSLRVQNQTVSHCVAGHNHKTQIHKSCDKLFLSVTLS